MNQRPDILDEIITQLDPENIPSEFIIMAKVRTYDGGETIVNGGDEFDDYMTQNADQVANVQVVFNVRRIRERVLDMTQDILRRSRQN
jgi:hypothetical protein